MSTTYLGSLTLGQCCPLALQATVTMNSSLLPQLNKLLADIIGLEQLIANVNLKPPSLALNIQLLEQMILGIQAALAIGVPPLPQILTALEAQLAQILQDVANLNLGLSFSANLAAILGSAGIFAYVYSGPASGLGSGIGSLTGGGLPDGGGATETCNALVLATATPATLGAMQLFFKMR